MDNRLKHTQRATWVSVFVNTLLTLLQIAIGLVAHSQALIAHGIHSFSDLLSDFLVLFAAQKSAAAPDFKHPYGHARFETLATLVLGASLFLIGAIVLWQSFAALISDAPLTNQITWEAPFIAFLTVIFKEALYHYLKHVALKWHSSLLLANALHTRADSASAVVVLIGILGAFWGVTILDFIAATLMGWMIAYAGATLIWESASELADTGLNEERILKIQNLLKNAEGVCAIHNLKTRKMAQNVLVEAHLEVDSHISVTESHRIAENARQEILKSEEDVVDVLIHIDPQDGTQNPDVAYQNLPNRAQVENLLQPVLRNLKNYKMILHYQNAQLLVSLFFQQALENQQEIENQLQILLKNAQCPVHLSCFVAIFDVQIL